MQSLGCNTTTHPHGIGKGAALKKVMKNPAFARVAEDMAKSDCCQEDMVKSGEKALVMIYNGVERESLKTLRYKRFREKVVKSSKYIEPHT